MREQNYRIEVDHPVTVADASGRSFAVNLDPNRPSYVTDEGVEVWIERPAQGSRSAQKTRFVDAEGTQHGPVHVNLVPAIVWAIAQGWRDPSSPDWWNDELAAEVAAGGATPDKHRTFLDKVGPWEEAADA